MADLQSGTLVENRGENDHFSTPGTVGATVGIESVPADPDLTALVAAWPTLSKAAKKRIVAEVRRTRR
jgi:hypothetical protein